MNNSGGCGGGGGRGGMFIIEVLDCVLASDDVGEATTTKYGYANTPDRSEANGSLTGC